MVKQLLLPNLTLRRGDMSFLLGALGDYMQDFNPVTSHLLSKKDRMMNYQGLLSWRMIPTTATTATQGTWKTWWHKSPHKEHEKQGFNFPRRREKRQLRMSPLLTITKGKTRFFLPMPHAHTHTCTRMPHTRATHAHTHATHTHTARARAHTHTIEAWPFS